MRAQTREKAIVGFNRVRLIPWLSGFVYHLLFIPTVVAGLFSRDRLLHPSSAAGSSLSTSTEVHVVDHLEAICNVTPHNTSFSVDLIAQLPLKTFEFKYDSIVGRTQMGLLGHDIKDFVPDGIVQVLPERLVMDQSTQRKVAIENFHVVDKDSLFMHNVAASQVLIDQVEHQKHQIRLLLKQLDQQQQVISQLEQYLAQEASAQLKEKSRIAQLEKEQIEQQIELSKQQFTKEKQILAQKLANEQLLESSKHELAVQRMQMENASRQAQNLHLVQLQEESNIRLELKRRETQEILKQKQIEADHQRALLEANTTLQKAQIDVEGRIKQQRVNQDIEMDQLRQRLEADRVKLLQALQAAFDNLGKGMMVLLTDKEKLGRFVGMFVVLATGVFVSRESIRIVGKFIEQRLGKPSLVRETSRASGIWGFIRSLFRRQRDNEEELADVVLRPLLETRVLEIAKSTKNAILHGAPYRHLLLYGPPGTGKTMVAKRLARCSGMDYAILSGGDVGPLGSDAVTELHALFRWANSSPRGVLIFIDEAEAFLGSRATRKTHMSEPMRNALNALLFHTGTQSRHFMLVIATNRPEDLDTAVTDRIDDTLHFELPEQKERNRLIQMYYEEFVASKFPTGKQFGGNALNKYGGMTKGMSGREIAKMMLYLQSVVFAQTNVHVTQKLIDRVVHEKVEEHKRKKQLKNYTDDQEKDG